MKVGITGGIGSGKTTVCKIFEKRYGIPVYYADHRAKFLMNHNPQLKAAIKSEFGNKVYHQNGRLHRAQLAKVVFNDGSKIKILNALVHPAVAKDSISWMKEKLKNHTYCLKEAALLFESKSAKELDKIIVVHADTEERIRRVIKRDKTTRKAVLARMSKQMDQKEKIKRADFLIENMKKSELNVIVEKIHLQLLALSQKKKSNFKI